MAAVYGRNRRSASRGAHGTDATEKVLVRNYTYESIIPIRGF